MSITGTGTLADPYICGTWAELTSVTGSQSQNYVKMADKANLDEKVIDFTEIQPYGFDEIVYLKGWIDFNGWVFKNFYSKAPIAIQIGGSGSGGGYTVWSNLIMKNFYHNFNSSVYQGNVAFISPANVQSDKHCDMINCQFYGELNYNWNPPTNVPKATFIGSNSNDSEYQTNFIECSLNIKVIHNRGVQLLCAAEMNGCRVNLDIESYSTNIFGDALSTNDRAIKYCRFTGNIENVDTTQNVYCGGTASLYNVYDIESNTPLEYHGNTVSVFNLDKASSAVSSSNFYACTSTQLKNGATLQSLGFPCAEKDDTSNHNISQIALTEGELDHSDWETIVPRSGYVTTPAFGVGTTKYIQYQLSAELYKYDSDLDSYELADRDITTFSRTYHYDLSITFLDSTRSSIGNISISNPNPNGIIVVPQGTANIVIAFLRNSYTSTPTYVQGTTPTIIIVMDTILKVIGYKNLWELTQNDELYIYDYLPEVDSLGAFANANNLTYISIPPSVKKIGRYSFRNTQLTSVRIADDCEYYPTSFPDGCLVYFY